ncbi:type I restriction enzyme HsdR N-terminal domain-containing protein [Criblamydia sequanensis]|uniref:Type I restriction enzyme R protein N-terminal domain-containing protein n=1 Tax=Candidatus Criblamydia sequanensis CRIB-18 TaxID=1437425 RepID=A0A090CXY5_9BACT|nr:type I restriction enzyme HsdR N-terminal domain-containing protein [Criblamydia sequanensis]CDR32976.1 hypothetical protein CSEC_0136 [Criblamydia sequanensis CRIB-18]
MPAADKLFCLSRNKWIASTPEEGVRQFFLHLMVKNLGFPKNLLSVEARLKNFLFESKKIPKRRADIIGFFPFKDTLKPLILIECKKGPLKEEDFYQASGYNFHLQAAFFGVASKNELMICDARKIEPAFYHIPPYQELVLKASRLKDS